MIFRTYLTGAATSPGYISLPTDSDMVLIKSVKMEPGSTHGVGTTTVPAIAVAILSAGTISTIGDPGYITQCRMTIMAYAINLTEGESYTLLGASEVKVDKKVRRESLYLDVTREATISVLVTIEWEPTSGGELEAVQALYRQ